MRAGVPAGVGTAGVGSGSQGRLGRAWRVANQSAVPPSSSCRTLLASTWKPATGDASDHAPLISSIEQGACLGTKGTHRLSRALVRKAVSDGRLSNGVFQRVQTYAWTAVCYACLGGKRCHAAAAAAQVLAAIEVAHVALVVDLQSIRTPLD